MQKIFLTIPLIMLCLFSLIKFSVIEYGTFNNVNNGYHGLYIVLDEPIRKTFELLHIEEIELKNNFLISFNTYEY